MAEYRGSQLSLLSTTLLFILTSSISVVSGQTTGVSLSLNGMTIPDDGYVLASDIGTADSGLHCNTDRGDCCHALDGVSQGHWYRPDGIEVMSFTAEDDARPEPDNFFARNRDTGIVRLNRHGTPSDRGRFRCEIPNASGVTVTLYVNIVDELPTTQPPMTTTDQSSQPLTTQPPISIIVAPITTVGPNTAGAIYSLECSVSVTGSTEQPTITWLDPMNNQITSGAETTGSMSTLTFNPLVASQDGMTYTCKATLGSMTRSQAFTVTVNVISVQVTPSSSTSPLPAGLTDFSLRCDVPGTGNLNSPTITYMWRREGIMISDQQGQTLTLSPLAASHAGRYICEATVASSSLSSDITSTSGNQTVNIQLPAPNTVTVSHGPISIGSTVTLTCTVVLRPLMDVAVTVNTLWTGPDRFMRTNTAQRVMGSTTTYTSTAMVSSFGREQSGVYICGANIDSAMSSFLVRSIQMNGMVRVTLGVYLSRMGTVYPNNSVISITEIGQTDPGSNLNEGLQCITDRMPCCAAMETRAGEWYFPDGTTTVPNQNSASSFYRNRGDDGTVNLNRLSTTIMMPTGLFCCVVPDAQDIAQRVCATITASVSVQIKDNVATPALGQSYSLTCEVTGASSPVSTYRWRRDGNVLSETGPTLSFSPLRLSNAGQYSCQVTVDGMMFTSPSQEIRLTIPPAASVSVTSDPSTPVNHLSTVTVTCTVELNSAILVSEVLMLLVSAQLSHPNGTMLSLSNSSTGIIFTYTTQLNSFRRNDSGNYICTATIEPQQTATFVSGSDSVSRTAEITIAAGVHFTLGGQAYRNDDNILISKIGGGHNALLCVTDQTQCCRGEDTPGEGGALGEWLYPNGTSVPLQRDGHDFYRNRGPSTVLLHRRNNATSPTGLYCCEVPDTTNTNKTTCINILSELPSTTTPTMPSGIPDEQESGANPGVVAGAIIVVILIVVAVIVALLIVFFLLRRRRSDKPYVGRSVKPQPTPPVAYAKTRNGSKIIGIEKNLKPQILKFPSDTNITEGEGVYFKIKVSGEPQPTVTWYHDGELVRADYAREIEADGCLAIPTAELKHSGVYKAVATNQHGSEEREIKLMVNEEGGASTVVAIDDMVSSRPIPIPEFGKYIAELHANSNQPFKNLYEALDTGEQGHTTTYATDVPRKNLNRFGNIVVYDDNRIVLQPLPELEDSQDYINACYVDGYSVPNKFIATQGPLPKTLVDFWHLIWQERPPTIVMVTNVKEGTRIKCQQYWPESGKKDFGPFQVTITDQQIFADYTIRTLSVSLGSGGRSHKVTQYHFTAWPDHGVPDYATPILAFHRRVKAQHHPSRGPMVIHCSAGVGRTGTFVVIDNILEQIEKEQVVDIPGAITKIRKKRMKMVQTHEQFMFIHDAILESVTCGDTQIAATNLRATLNRMKKKDPLNHRNAFEHQFQILEQVTPKPKEVICNKALQYSDRNRGDKFLPADRWRVILKGEQRDYINAVNINGYKQHKAFIIAQGPLKSTVRNFWKMIYDRKSAVIVMLSDLKEEGQEASAQYWPSSGSYKYGEYTVELMGEEPLEGFVIRDLSVTDDRTQQAHKVTQFHITCWGPGGHCSNLKSVTDVIEEITKVQIRSGNKPIVVHCSDTVTRSGTFCAIATTIERCKTEGVVDVFQVVKALRVQKPGAVPTVSQYKTIFDTVLVFLESFDTYANFQNI